MSYTSTPRSNQNTPVSRPGTGSTDNGTVKVYTSSIPVRTGTTTTPTTDDRQTPVINPSTPNGTQNTASAGIDSTMAIGLAAVGGALLLKGNKKKRK